MLSFPKKPLWLIHIKQSWEILKPVTIILFYSSIVLENPFSLAFAMINND